MKQVIGTTDVKTVEFMMDLPESMSIKAIELKEDKVLFTCETELDLPDNVTLVYQTDGYGNVALTNME